MGIPGDIPFGEDVELRCFGHGAKGRYSYDYHTAKQGHGGGYCHSCGLGFCNGDDFNMVYYGGGFDMAFTVLG